MAWLTLSSTLKADTAVMSHDGQTQKYMNRNMETKVRKQKYENEISTKVRRKVTFAKTGPNKLDKYID